MAHFYLTRLSSGGSRRFPGRTAAVRRRAAAGAAVAGRAGVARLRQARGVLAWPGLAVRDRADAVLAGRRTRLLPGAGLSDSAGRRRGATRTLHRGHSPEIGTASRGERVCTYV